LSWGFLTATDPVIVTEFGDTETACATAYSAALIQYADAHLASWTAWAWYPGGCSFPALIDDWVATPSAVGEIVKAALLSYGDASAPPPDGGTADGGATE
jgi:endoglucanase